MGVPWAIDISPNAIFPYAKEGWALSSLGSCIARSVSRYNPNPTPNAPFPDWLC